MKKKKIIYIVNPHSGVGKKSVIENAIREQTDNEQVEYEILHTKYHGHATELSRNYRDLVDCVVAVGGDGTVNEVGSGLIGSSTALAIIPAGSGNGLARELDIPMRTSLAIEVVNELNIKKIDVMRVAEHFSLNMSGIGFDAFVSHEFAKVKTRGPLQYMNLITRKFPDYEAKDYILKIDGNILKSKAFLISFANSAQWGNNIRIAPKAQVDDGLIDVCILSDFPDVAIPSLLFSLFNQSIEKNKYDEIIKAKSIEIQNDRELKAHVDGEPIIIAPGTEISILPLALNVVIPSQKFLNSRRFDTTTIKNLIQSNLSQIQFPNIKNR